MERKTILGIILLAVVLALIIAGMKHEYDKDAPRREAYQSLAQCLSNNGATFYGLFSCPACGQQKIMFEGSVKQLPYVECAGPSRQGQAPVCEEANIQDYPTWQFASGMRCVGVVDARVLAHLADCAVPDVAGEQAPQTPRELFDTLAREPLLERMRQRETPEDEMNQVLTILDEQVNRILTENHGTTIDTEEDGAHMLDAIAQVIYQCAQQEEVVADDEEV